MVINICMSFHQTLKKNLEDVEFLLMMLTLNMDISEVNMYYFLMM